MQYKRDFCDDFDQTSIFSEPQSAAWLRSVALASKPPAKEEIPLYDGTFKLKSENILISLWLIVQCLQRDPARPCLGLPRFLSTLNTLEILAHIRIFKK